MGWRVNTANLNHRLFDPDTFGYTETMKRKGTAYVFKCLEQTTLGGLEIRESSFKDKMDENLCKPYAYKEGLGINMKYLKIYGLKSSLGSED